MNPFTQAVLLSWSIPPAASFALGLIAIIYLRGWFLMRRAGVPFVPTWRAACFVAGLLTVWMALASPLDTFASFIITAHMSQHMLLMMIAPPLILLGAPLIPLVRGLPVFAAREFAGPFLNWRLAKRVGRALTNLWIALVLMGIVMFAWHTPRLYELALTSAAWHEIEHACFFVASLLFWWPVVQPWPSQAQSQRWQLVPYLLIADLQNTILSAILVFSDRVLYPSYSQMPRLFGLSALHDQAASGAIMWVVGSAAFLVPAVMIALHCLSGRRVSLAHDVARNSDSLNRGVSSAPGLLHRSTPLTNRVGERKAQAITFVCLFVAAGLTLAALASRNSDDDQALIARPTSGPLTLFVFGAGELQPGPNELAFLVQESRSQQTLREAIVDIRVEHDGGLQPGTPVRAVPGESENKLLHIADLDLPGGRSRLRISVAHGGSTAEFSQPVEAVPSQIGSVVPWPYAVLFVIALTLFCIYVLRDRRTSCVPRIATEELPFPNKAS